MPILKRPDVRLGAALFVAGLALRFLLLTPHRFDGLYGQDSYAYYDFAQALRQVVSGGAAPGTFFWPLGYPTLLAAVFALFGTSATTGQAINVLLGASLAPFVYILTRQMSVGRAGALAAGILMAVSGQALQSSLVLMADIPALAWATVSAVALWAYLRGQKRRWLVVAAITLALASVTRWLYLSLAVPWGLAVLLGKPIRWRDLPAAAIPAALVLLLQLAYSSTSPYPTFNHAWVEGWSIQNAFRREFVNVDGHFLYDLENWRYYAQPFYDAYYLAPLFTPFLLVGLLALFIRRQRTQAVMLVGWGFLPFVFLAGIPYQNIRFPLIVFPAVAVLAGLGLETAARWAQRYTRRVGWVVCGIVLVVGSEQTLRVAQDTVDTFIANQQRDKDIAQWAAGDIPAGATVYTFGLTLTLKHYTSLNVYELYYESRQTLDERWTRGRADYLLLDVWNIEHQWTGREPQIAFHWLRDARGLTEMGRYGNYMLYRIEG